MKKFIVIAVIVCLFVSSCAPVYVPNARNSPMFTKAGEFQGSLQLGNGLDVQGAVSVSNHIGLMGNFSYANNKSPDPDDSDDYHRHKFFEGGIGYFENQGKWCYEIFAGYGEGEGSSFDEYDFFSSGSSSTVRATGKFNRIFIQPAFGLNKKMFHVSFVPRISLVDFTEFTSDDAGGVAPYIANDDPKVFIEPAVMGRINLMSNRMFFTFQGGFSVPATKVYYEYRPFYVSTGIGFRIGGTKADVQSETN
jgi:hypothetical protein